MVCVPVHLKVTSSTLSRKSGRKHLAACDMVRGLVLTVGLFFRSFLVLLLICELCGDSTDCSVFSLVGVKFPVISVSGACVFANCSEKFCF